MRKLRAATADGGATLARDSRDRHDGRSHDDRYKHDGQRRKKSVFDLFDFD